MNDRLDRLLDRGHTEALRDAELIIRQVLTDRRVLTLEQIEVLREIRLIADRGIWHNLRGNCDD
jgi:hypothetical protein